MENSTHCLIESICDFFLQKQCSDDPNVDVTSTQKNKNVTSLIQLHNEKLSRIGDISFPSNVSIWRNYFSDSKTLRDEAFSMFIEGEEGEVTQTAAEETKRDFLSAASNWLYPVQRMKIQGDRCALFLQRSSVISYCLRQVLNHPHSAEASYGHLKKNTRRRVYVHVSKVEGVSELSLYRAKLIKDTLRRLLLYSTWTEVAENECSSSEVLQLHVVSITEKGTRSNNEDNECTKTVRCGIVCDPTTGKLVKLGTQDYHNLRSNDMRLMAMHKYGIRVKDDRRFCALIERLGAAAVTVDLLEVKHSSPVHIIRKGQGSTKGASFILYNSARLETLLRTFDERVQNTVYEQLPPIDAIDFSLLNEEEEWQLVYGFIFAFPNLIERCLEQLNRGVCATHLLVRFLSGFVSIFSVYYRRIRILTEKRDHLMPYVYARIYLVKAVNNVLNKTLALLNIEPVSFM